MTMNNKYEWIINMNNEYRILSESLLAKNFLFDLLL